MAKSSPADSNEVTVLEGVVAFLHCLVLLAAASVVLDRYLQNRQLQAVASAQRRHKGLRTYSLEGSGSVRPLAVGEDLKRRSA